MTTKTMRTHVLLPRDLVEEVDQIAGPRRRSEFIAEAVEKELRARRRSTLGRELMGSLAHVDIPGWESSEAATEWVRENRRRSDRFDAFGRAIERDS